MLRKQREILSLVRLPVPPLQPTEILAATAEAPQGAVPRPETFLDS
jgi:hypothetical protein